MLRTAREVYGEGQRPPLVKKAGRPPNMGGREVGALTAGLRVLRSAIVMAPAPGPARSRFQRAMLASLGSGTGWPNLLKEPFGRSGKMKLVKSAMLRRLSFPVRSAGQALAPQGSAGSVPIPPSSTDVQPSPSGSLAGSGGVGVGDAA